MKNEVPYSIQTADVLVIGSGGAGVRATIELHDRGVDVLMVGKCKKREAHTIWATGGINAALGTMDKKDSWQLHAADTIRDGEFINDTDAVITLCKNAPKAVQELAKWGCPFHKEKNGKISQRFFGAATYRRACFVGDKTGKAILNTLIDQALKRKVRFKPEVYITRLLKDGQGAANGAVGLDLRTGRFIVFHAKAVIMAAGGHSRMFKRSSSLFWENNGDGIALAHGAGAAFMDMEMFQFHPTGMVHPKVAEGVLVTEAVRGEGGILTNSKGERFMDKYDPQRMELSARDIVARANYNEIYNGRGTKHNAVYLDITHRPKSYILKRLPRMYEQFKKYAKVDISKEKMEVAPTAHYSMGGIFVDHTTGRTTIENLYAIGEVTAGTHGGNRLGGNSLAEIVVFGRLTGANVAKDVKQRKHTPLEYAQIEEAITNVQSLTNAKTGVDPIKAKQDIQELMWKGVGVVRNAKGMQQAQRALKKYKRIKLKTGKKLVANEKLIAALDVHNMIPTCEMILTSALERTESRAAHYRSDYPKMQAKWKKNIIIQGNGKGNYTMKKRPVKPVPKSVAKHIEKRVIDTHHHHMLE